MKHVLIFILCLNFSTLLAQKNIATTNCISISDSSIKIDNTNSFNIYLKNNQVKKIEFLNYFNIHEIEFDVKLRCNNLSIEIRYTPRLLDYDILAFKYDKAKNDWKLSSFSEYRFSPINPNLTSELCVSKPKTNIWISKLDYAFLRKNTVNDRVKSNKYFYAAKCTTKQESD